MAERAGECKGAGFPYGGAVLRSVVRVSRPCLDWRMRESWTESTGGRWRAKILSPFLAVLLLLASFVPAFEPVLAAPVSGMMAADCPMEHGHGKTAHEKACCFCILCVTGSLAAASHDGISLNHRRFATAAPVIFATGVSATHGPKWTANLPTGPPEA
jgi:hypothetical protein